ncbi:MAG: type II toxin-antitoxin system VapC family toxin [Gemmatimonadota bacterium]
MIVVDASAVLEVLLATPAAQAVAERILGSGESLHAPHLLDVEVAQVVRRYWRTREVDALRGWQALEDLSRFPVERYAHEPLLARIWELRASAPAYDAVYLALSEALEAPLVTCDVALASVPGYRGDVEVFA